MSQDEYVRRLEGELTSLHTQMRWFNRFAVVLGVASLAGALYAWWVPLAGIAFAASLAGVAWYIGNVHAQYVREQIANVAKST